MQKNKLISKLAKLMRAGNFVAYSDEIDCSCSEQPSQMPGLILL